MKRCIWFRKRCLCTSKSTIKAERRNGTASMSVIALAVVCWVANRNNLHTFSRSKVCSSVWSEVHEKLVVIQPNSDASSSHSVGVYIFLQRLHRFCRGMAISHLCFAEDRRSVLLMLLLISGIEPNPGPRPTTRANHYKTNFDQNDDDERLSPFGQDIEERQPDYPCGICGKECDWGDDSLACDNCDQWIHCECLGISVALYKELGSSKDPWRCPACEEDELDCLDHLQKMMSAKGGEEHGRKDDSASGAGTPQPPPPRPRALGRSPGKRGGGSKKSKLTRSEDTESGTNVWSKLGVQKCSICGFTSAEDGVFNSHICRRKSTTPQSTPSATPPSSPHPVTLRGTPPATPQMLPPPLGESSLYGIQRRLAPREQSPSPILPTCSSPKQRLEPNLVPPNNAQPKQPTPSIQSSSEQSACGIVSTNSVGAAEKKGYITYTSADKQFHCLQCGFRRGDDKHFLEHLLYQIDAKPYHCSDCDEAFESRTLLGSHISSKHPTVTTRQCRLLNLKQVKGIMKQAQADEKSGQKTAFSLHSVFKRCLMHSSAAGKGAVKVPVTSTSLSATQQGTSSTSGHPVSSVPTASQSAVPETSKSSVPASSESVPTVPTTSQPAGNESAVPAASESTVPAASESTVPAASESTVPAASESSKSTASKSDVPVLSEAVLGVLTTCQSAVPVVPATSQCVTVEAAASSPSVTGSASALPCVPPVTLSDTCVSVVASSSGLLDDGPACAVVDSPVSLTAQAPVSPLDLTVSSGSALGPSRSVDTARIAASVEGSSSFTSDSHTSLAAIASMPSPMTSSSTVHWSNVSGQDSVSQPGDHGESHSRHRTAASSRQLAVHGGAAASLSQTVQNVLSSAAQSARTSASSLQASVRAAPESIAQHPLSSALSASQHTVRTPSPVTSIPRTSVQFTTASYVAPQSQSSVNTPIMNANRLPILGHSQPSVSSAYFHPLQLAHGIRQGGQVPIPQNSFFRLPLPGLNFQFLQHQQGQFVSQLNPSGNQTLQQIQQQIEQRRQQQQMAQEAQRRQQKQQMLQEVEQRRQQLLQEAEHRRNFQRQRELVRQQERQEALGASLFDCLNQTPLPSVSPGHGTPWNNQVLSSEALRLLAEQQRQSYQRGSAALAISTAASAYAASGHTVENEQRRPVPILPRPPALQFTSTTQPSLPGRSFGIATSVSVDIGLSSASVSGQPLEVNINKCAGGVAVVKAEKSEPKEQAVTTQGVYSSATSSSVPSTVAAPQPLSPNAGYFVRYHGRFTCLSCPKSFSNEQRQEIYEHVWDHQHPGGVHCTSCNASHEEEDCTRTQEAIDNTSSHLPKGIWPYLSEDARKKILLLFSQPGSRSGSPASSMSSPQPSASPLVVSTPGTPTESRPASTDNPTTSSAGEQQQQAEPQAQNENGQSLTSALDFGEGDPGTSRDDTTEGGQVPDGENMAGAGNEESGDGTAIEGACETTAESVQNSLHEQAASQDEESRQESLTDLLRCSQSDSDTETPEVPSPPPKPAEYYTRYECFFICTLCEFSCPLATDFTMHLNSEHPVEKEFPCYHCHYKGKYTTDLTNHVSYHLNEEDHGGKFKIYPCPRSSELNPCDYSTDNLKAWAEHVKIPHASDSYQCRKCDENFPDADGLHHHLSQNSMTLYSCKDCPTRFVGKSAIVQHRRVHHNGVQHHRVIKMLLCADRKSNGYQPPAHGIRTQMSREDRASGEGPVSRHGSVSEAEPGPAVDVAQAPEGERETSQNITEMAETSQNITEMAEKQTEEEEEMSENITKMAEKEHEEETETSKNIQEKENEVETELSENNPGLVDASLDDSAEDNPLVIDEGDSMLVRQEDAVTKDTEEEIARRGEAVVEIQHEAQTAAQVEEEQHETQVATQVEDDTDLAVNDDVIPITDLFGSEELHSLLLDGSLCAEEDGKFLCLLCDPPKEFHKTKKLHEHLFIHTEKWLLRCLLCELGFNLKSQVTTHFHQEHPGLPREIGKRNVRKSFFLSQLHNRAPLTRETFAAICNCLEEDLIQHTGAGGDWAATPALNISGMLDEENTMLDTADAHTASGVQNQAPLNDVAEQSPTCQENTVVEALGDEIQGDCLSEERHSTANPDPVKTNRRKQMLIPRPFFSSSESQQSEQSTASQSSSSSLLDKTVSENGDQANESTEPSEIDGCSINKFAETEVDCDRPSEPVEVMCGRTSESSDDFDKNDSESVGQLLSVTTDLTAPGGLTGQHACPSSSGGIKHPVTQNTSAPQSEVMRCGVKSSTSLMARPKNLTQQKKPSQAASLSQKEDWKKKIAGKFGIIKKGSLLKHQCKACGSFVLTIGGCMEHLKSCSKLKNIESASAHVKAAGALVKKNKVDIFAVRKYPNALNAKNLAKPALCPAPVELSEEDRSVENERGKITAREKSSATSRRNPQARSQVTDGQTGKRTKRRQLKTPQYYFADSEEEETVEETNEHLVENDGDKNEMSNEKSSTAFNRNPGSEDRQTKKRNREHQDNTFRYCLSDSEEDGVEEGEKTVEDEETLVRDLSDAVNSKRKSSDSSPLPVKSPKKLKVGDDRKDVEGDHETPSLSEGNVLSSSPSLVIAKSRKRRVRQIWSSDDDDGKIDENYDDSEDKNKKAEEDKAQEDDDGDKEENNDKSEGKVKHVEEDQTNEGERSGEQQRGTNVEMCKPGNVNKTSEGLDEKGANSDSLAVPGSRKERTATSSSPNYNYTCKYCPHSTSDPEEMQAHLPIHAVTTTLLKCGYCDYLYGGAKDSLKLKRHTVTEHTGQKEVSESPSWKSFVTMTVLKNKARRTGPRVGSPEPTKESSTPSPKVYKAKRTGPKVGSEGDGDTNSPPAVKNAKQAESCATEAASDTSAPLPNNRGDGSAKASKRPAHGPESIEAGNPWKKKKKDDGEKIPPKADALHRKLSEDSNTERDSSLGSKEKDQRIVQRKKMGAGGSKQVHRPGKQPAAQDQQKTAADTSQSSTPEFKCKFCDQLFFGLGAAGSMKNHLHRHELYKTYTCGLCPLQFYTLDDTKDHGQQQHPGESVQPQVRRDPQKELKIRQLIDECRTYASSVSRIEKENDPLKTRVVSRTKAKSGTPREDLLQGPTIVLSQSIQCVACEALLDCISAFKEHCDAKHQQPGVAWLDLESKVKFTILGKPLTETPAIMSHRYLCAYCPLRAKSRDLIARHKEDVHSDKPNWCLQLKSFSPFTAATATATASSVEQSAPAVSDVQPPSLVPSSSFPAAALADAEISVAETENIASESETIASEDSRDSSSTLSPPPPIDISEDPRLKQKAVVLLENFVESGTIRKVLKTFNLKSFRFPPKSSALCEIILAKVRNKKKA